MNLLDNLGQEIREAPSFSEAARAVCVSLRRELSHHHWVGIYMIDGDYLILRAWDGSSPTEHTRIHVSTGICGMAVREGRPVIVDDVRNEPRYLACFTSTRSEIVVPIWRDARIIGEIDIDSDQIGAFGDTDLAILEFLADRLAARAG